MKKALIVANLAGFASFLMYDIETLQEMGYEVTFAANADKLAWEDTREKLEERGVAFVQIDFDSKSPLAKQNRRAYGQLKRLLKEGGFSFMHCHTPIAGILARLAAHKYRKRGMKVVYTTHGLSYTSYSSRKSRLIYRTIEKMGAKRCDAIITINQEDFEEAKTLGCAQVYYIHGVGVDTEKYEGADIDREAYRATLDIPADKTFVLSVGELSPRKNHGIIIDALAALENKDDYVYAICGNGIDGGVGEELKQKAADTGVDLRLLGFRFDIPEVIACSDIGAIPSVREGLGLAGIQSLAAGIPLVGTNVQGIRDYIKDGETGYLSLPYDAQGFAEGIVKLSNREVREDMKDACRKTAKGFDKEVSVCEMKEIYKTLLG